ncbi:MAG: rhomboid family intramembrane serine protease [Alsobacter sp.]
MFLPLYDIAPLRHVQAPWVTRGLLAANLLVFLLGWTGLVPGGLQREAVVAGLFPSVLFREAMLPPELGAFPAPVTLVTSIFVHGGWLHLAGNMLFLQVFGDNVEDALGHWRFLLFYLLCGMAGGLAHAYAFPLSEQPLVGASGAVAGVIGAYLLLHPRALVWGLALNVIPLRIRAYWVLGLWGGVQLWHLVTGEQAGTAWWAHLGGFLAGIVLLFVLRRRATAAMA